MKYPRFQMWIIQILKKFSQAMTIMFSYYLYAWSDMDISLVTKEHIQLLMVKQLTSKCVVLSIMFSEAYGLYKRFSNLLDHLHTLMAK